MNIFELIQNTIFKFFLNISWKQKYFFALNIYKNVHSLKNPLIKTPNKCRHPVVLFS